MSEFKCIQLITSVMRHSFVGKHLPERERPNWHYYQDKDGSILHCRKEHMVMVIEKELEDENG